MCIGLRIKYPLLLSGFDETWDFLDRFSQNTQISNFLKILPVGDELLHSNRLTDTSKLIVAFRNFANALNARL